MMVEGLRQTPLHPAHVRLGAKLVPFCGWEMPIHYAGTLAEHAAVRANWGIFDVSHMGEVDFRGPDAVGAVDTLVTNDVGALVPGRALYTVACHPNGGIVDDCIVYRLAEDHLRIVVNAANVAKDTDHFRAAVGSRCEIEDRSEAFALIAAQGPKAVERLAEVCGASLQDTPSFGLTEVRLAGADVLAARTGYTGEDGFELFVASSEALGVWDRLLERGAQPIGLGARDTLRLEARLSLYGNDIDDDTNPYEAGLGWVVKLAKPHDFIGKSALTRIKASGPARKLVGFRVVDRGVVRAGAEVLGVGDTVVGTVRSGGVAPTVGGAIGLAYVPASMAGDTSLRLRQRGKVLRAEPVKGPFYRRA